jgi:hypothetical protein
MAILRLPRDNSLAQKSFASAQDTPVRFHNIASSNYSWSHTLSHNVVISSSFACLVGKDNRLLCSLWKFKVSACRMEWCLQYLYQFSRYISTPSTTTATSDPATDLSPPSDPPPPPPPLNIPPSRARRQLAARLALHSKQNADNEGELDHDDVEDHQIGINPFAADEDDEDEDDAPHHDEFTIGDLEAEEEGKGHLPAATPLVGGKEPVEEVVREEVTNANVGMPFENRNSFPALWPFGSQQPPRDHYKSKYTSVSGGEQGEAGGHFKGFRGRPDADDSSQSDSDSDDEFVAGAKPERRPSTVEATRRTSIEDDDDDDEEGEVVHIARERESGNDDELIEVHHAEN